MRTGESARSSWNGWAIGRVRVRTQRTAKLESAWNCRRAQAPGQDGAAFWFSQHGLADAVAQVAVGVELRFVEELVCRRLVGKVWVSRLVPERGKAQALEQGGGDIERQGSGTPTSEPHRRRQRDAVSVALPLAVDDRAVHAASDRPCCPVVIEIGTSTRQRPLA